jgi:hypothetical protein
MASSRQARGAWRGARTGAAAAAAARRRAAAGARPWCLAAALRRRLSVTRTHAGGGGGGRRGGATRAHTAGKQIAQRRDASARVACGGCVAPAAAARSQAARGAGGGAERGTRTGGRRLHRRGQLNGRSVVEAAAAWRGARACATSAAAPREAETTAPLARGGRRLVQTWQRLHSRQGWATERSGAPRARAARHALAPGSEAAAVLEVAAHRLARLQTAADGARQRGKRDMGTPRKVRAAGAAAAPRPL